MAEKIFRARVKILRARIGLSSNREDLLPSFPPPVEVKSLLTDFKALETVPYSRDADGWISILENREQEPLYSFSRDRATFKGPLIALTRKASDLRFSLWGNQGFLYRFALYLLEKKHQIYNLHACALYQKEKNRLFVIAGGAGSGKTVYLLSGLERGLALFSTETVHFKLEEDRTCWFMGSLVDNIRRGTLRHDFPRFLPGKEDSSSGKEWEEKIALDLSARKSPQETLLNPQLVLLFPRIEEGRDGFLLSPIPGERKKAKAIFDNITEKIALSVVLYDAIIVPGLDCLDLAKARWQACLKLARRNTTQLIASVLSSPRQCWGDLLQAS